MSLFSKCNFFIDNVALPYMQGSLNAGTDEITWVLTSYLVSNAVVLPMTGWLARMFGRKRFLLTCIVLFTVISFVAHINPYSPVFQQRFAALQETALAKGGMPGQVESKVMALLYGEVGRQAGVQSYNRIFWLLGIMYIAMIPLVLLLKREKTDHS
ncbi:MAG: transporter, family, multidrug resistance protein [Desulfuromonadales bacterium]|jgi:MFS family permease|nr:transporter, family, multidrug resistance protein [Desulfuromonadales bacterium]